MTTIYFATIIQQNGVTVNFSTGLNINRIKNATAEGNGTRISYDTGNSISSLLLSQDFTTVSEAISSYGAGQKVQMPYSAYMIGVSNTITLSGALLIGIDEIIYVNTFNNTASVVIYNGNVISTYTLIITQSQFIDNCNVGSGDAGLIILSSSTISLNPTITCNFAQSGGPLFQAGMAVNDIFGNSGNIITTDGETTMTLNNMNASSPPRPATFSGTINGTGSTTATTAPSTQTMVLAFTLGGGSPRAVIGNTVTDSLGSTGIIEATNGTTTMTLGSLNMVASSGFTGLITFGSTGTGTAGAQSLNVPFSSLVGNWYLTGKVTDTNGNQGTLQTVTGDVLTLVTLTFSGTKSSFSGVISESIAATGSVTSFSWGDQAIAVPAGSSIMDIWLGKCPTAPAAAADGQWWTDLNRTGTQLFNTNESYTPFQKLVVPENFINTTINPVIGYSFITPTPLTTENAMITTPDTIYFTLGSVEGTDLSLTQNIYGYTN